MQAIAMRGYKAGKPLKKPEIKPVANPLKSALEKFLDNVANFRTIESVCELLKDIKPSPEEVEAAITCFSEHPRVQEAGFFLSASYYLRPEKVIMHRSCSDIMLNDVGYKLPKDKTLIIAANTYAEYVGDEAEGIIIHHGTAGQFGSNASGLLITRGEVGEAAYNFKGIMIIDGKTEMVGAYASGILFVLKRPKDHISRDSKQIFDPVDYRRLPGLKHYLKELLKPFTPETPLEEQLEAAKQLDRNDIEAKIKNYLDKISIGETTRWLKRLQWRYKP